MLTTGELRQWFDTGITGSNRCLNDLIAEHVLETWQQIERLILSGRDPYSRDAEEAMRAIVRRFDEVSLATLKAGADSRYRSLSERANKQLSTALKHAPRLIWDDGATA